MFQWEGSASRKADGGQRTRRDKGRHLRLSTETSEKGNLSMYSARRPLLSDVPSDPESVLTGSHRLTSSSTLCGNATRRLIQTELRYTVVNAS